METGRMREAVKLAWEYKLVPYFKCLSQAVPASVQAAIHLLIRSTQILALPSKYAHTGMTFTPEA
jgi:hypothetical protein